MKKLLVLLLISILAIFAFAGCDGFTPAEGEGEGEGEVEGVTVEVADSVNVAGKDWVAAGTHDITVTFPAPVEGNVEVTITDCSGDYPLSKADSEVVMFPDADRKVWTGSGTFGGDTDEPCCASYIEVTAGECADDVCIVFPIIVDAGDPYAQIKVTTDFCTCEDCDLDFEICTECVDVCAEDSTCCGDYCTAITGGAIVIYDEEPFDKCCETPCAEPVFTCPITECPEGETEFCPTECLDETKTYYMVVNLLDAVGNETEYYATLDLTRDDSAETCSVIVQEYNAVSGTQDCECTDWSIDARDGDTSDAIIGECSEPDTSECVVGT